MVGCIKAVGGGGPTLFSILYEHMFITVPFIIISRIY